MKKKVVLIAAVILFCSGILIFANGLQKNVTSGTGIVKTNEKVTVTKEQNTAADHQTGVGESNQNTNTSSSNSNITGSNTKNNTDTTVKTVTSAEQESTKNNSTAAPNFKIINAMNGKVLLSEKVNFNNETVADITVNVLKTNNIIYKASGFGALTYFSMIDNLAERQNGPESGWCYYINGVKCDVGTGSYKPKSSDTIVWKYLKDGLSN